MSTHFDTNFDDSSDDIIHANHVIQYAQPIKDLESGKAFYRVATGSGAPYQVSFRLAASTGGTGHHIDHPSTPGPHPTPLSLLSAGQEVIFKANINSPASASLAILLEDGGSGTLSVAYPLFAGGAQVGANEIKAEQIVMAVYNDTSTPRFDVIGVASAGGGVPTSRLVSTTAPLAGGGDLTANRTLSIAKATASVDGYLGATDFTAFNNKVATSRSISTTAPLAGGGDLSANRTLSISKATASVDGYLGATDFTTFNNKVGTSRSVSTTGPLAGGGDLSANRTLSIAKATVSVDGYLGATDFATFNGKQNALTAPGDVPGMTTALAAKESTAQKGVANGYAGLDSSGKVPSAQLPASGGGAPTSRMLTTNAPLTGGGDLSADRTLSITKATASVDGYLGATDFATFNGKQNALTSPGDVPGMTAALAAKESIAQKGVANGYAGLGADGKVPAGQLPTSGGAPTSRMLATNAPLAGGGDLSADRTLSIAKATASVDGYLGATDFVTFNGKQNALTAPGDVPGMSAALSAKEDQSQKGVANGYAGLGPDGKVPAAQLPSGGGLTSPVAIIDGGTGSTTATNARIALGANNAANITTGTLPVARGGTGLSTFTGAGRIPYSTSATALATLALGAADMVLTSNGSSPSWAALPGACYSWRGSPTGVTSNIVQWSTASNNLTGSGVSIAADRITVSSAGVYLVVARTILYNAAANTSMSTYLQINGTNTTQSTDSVRNDGTTTTLVCTTFQIFDASSGDYFRVYANQSISAGQFAVVRIA